LRDDDRSERFYTACTHLSRSGWRRSTAIEGQLATALCEG
jgi:hypothetical protein